MGKHKSGSIQVYKLSDRQQHTDQPSFPNQGDDNAIQNKWCKGNEINNQQNQKYTARKSQEALWPYRTKKKKNKKKKHTPIWNDVHANFLVWDWNDIFNGIIVIQGKEVVDWLVS